MDINIERAAIKRISMGLLKNIKAHLFGCYYAATALAIVVWALIFNIDLGDEGMVSHLPATDQQIMSQGAFAVFNGTGRLLYDGVVDNVHYSSNREQFNFKTTDVRYETDTGHLEIDSETGRFFPEKNTFIFDNEVVVKRMEGKGAEASVKEELRTQSLTILATENTARSDAYAEIKSKGRVITGKGIEINLTDGKLKLLEDVSLRS